MSGCRRVGAAGRRVAAGLLCVFALVQGLAGCSSLGYYTQAVGGHLDVLARARPVPDVLADEATPPALRERLQLSQRLRDFAVSELKLPDNASYRRYADLQRPAAVWNVVAAPELDLRLKTWCFAVVGCVGYRGYFERAQADQQAAALRAQGYEVQVYAVPAYSSLGKLPGDYFADPLLNTFIGQAEPDLARLIFHELAHQVAYAEGDTEFNEAFATAVERLGYARWLARGAPGHAPDVTAVMDQRRADFRAMTLRARAELAELYRSDRSEAAKRVAKAEVMARLRAEHAALKAGPWQGYAGFDAWMAQANNASLATLAAYHALVPAFERLFEAQGRDFERFYAEVKRLSALPRADRRATLETL